MTTCTGFDCERPSRDAYLCKACTRDLERRLAELPALLDELTTSLTRQTRTSEQSGRGSEPVLVVNLKAASVTAALTVCLRRAVKKLTTVGQHIPCTCGHAHIQHHVRRCRWGRCTCPDYRPTDTFTTHSMAQWLHYRVKLICLDATAAKLLDELQGITTRLVAVIDLPEDLRTIPVGQCPESDDTGSRCPGEIRAHIPRDEGKPPRMECTICHVVYDTPQWARAGKRITPRSRPDGQIRGPLLRDAADRHIRPAVVGELGPYPDGSKTGGRARLAYTGDDDDVLEGLIP